MKQVLEQPKQIEKEEISGLKVPEIQYLTKSDLDSVKAELITKFDEVKTLKSTTPDNVKGEQKSVFKTNFVGVLEGSAGAVLAPIIGSLANQYVPQIPIFAIPVGLGIVLLSVGLGVKNGNSHVSYFGFGMLTGGIVLLFKATITWLNSQSTVVT
jgi:hypothetical protein